MDIRPGKPGTTFLEFSVSNTGDGNTWERVEITSVVMAGWQSIPSPSFLILNQGECKNVMVFITANRNEVPPFTTYCELRATVTDGSGCGGSASDSENGTLKIEQHSLILFDADTLYKKLSPGLEHVFSFNISNIGYKEDRIKFQIDNQTELEELGWVIEKQNPIYIKPDQNKTVKLLLRTPKGSWKDEIHTINFTVISMNDERCLIKSPIIIWVRGINIPGIEPMFVIIIFGIIIVVVKKRFR